MGMTSTHNSVDDDDAVADEEGGTITYFGTAIGANDCGGLSTRINEMWESANTINHLLSASRVSTLLMQSGLAKHALRAIWTKAKKGSKTAKGVMNKEEFGAACELVVEGGGTFSSSSEIETNAADSVAVAEPAQRHAVAVNDAYMTDEPAERAAAGSVAETSFEGDQYLTLDIPTAAGEAADDEYLSVAAGLQANANIRAERGDFDC